MCHTTPLAAPLRPAPELQTFTEQHLPIDVAVVTQGVPDCVNGELLRGTLNTDWQLRGFVISDAGAVGHSSDVPSTPPGQNYTHGELLMSGCNPAAAITLRLR